MRLAGRRALITGGSRGFGLAVARRFVQEGARVVVAARDVEALSLATSVELRTLAQGPFGSCPTDVASEAQVRRLVDYAVNHLGGIDVLVANAGVYGPIGRLEDVDWAEWQAAVSINLYGVVLCCRAVLPLMRQQGHGKIIGLSGGGASRPMPNFSAYAASKAAVVRFLETLACETVGSGIDVNAVGPGPMSTRMLEQVLRAGPGRAGEDAWNQAYLQACNPRSMDAGTDLVTWLASSASDGVTGRLISAVWDDWREPGFREALADPEAGTLRRVKPAVKDVVA